MAQETTVVPLYPLLAQTGKFGYCDSTGNSIIPARFDEAQPFKNGYAVASVNQQYGVIDLKGKTIVPFKYPYADLFSDGLFAVAITKKEYNAWWRCWQWKILPEFNVLSTGNKGPFLVTKVPRAKWKIRSLQGGKVLFRQRRMDLENAYGSYWKKDWEPYRSVPRDILISSSGRNLQVQHRSFQLGAGNKLKQVNGHFFDFINDTTALVFKNGQYYKSGINGKSTDQITYTEAGSLLFNRTSGKTIVVKKQRQDMYPYTTISTAVFKSNEGKYYLFPDLYKPLPADIQDYKKEDDTATAAEIMGQAIIISSIPDSEYFLVLSIFGKSKESRCLLLDTNGHWYTKIPAYAGLDMMLSNGDLLFTRGAKKGMMGRDLLFKSLPFSENAAPCYLSVDLYSGKDAATGKYGIYDVQKQTWQVMPVYDYIGNEIVPGIIVYTAKIVENGHQKEMYGLLDIQHNKVITPPLYHHIDGDGLVRKTENGKEISFYINRVNGKEYRE
ncbi:WG repeat-containing protein [Chitinophaga niastensis]|nr:WG repeat-containing protein [Chitinophaga niastensis]